MVDNMAVKNRLAEGETRVSFTKSNGERRNMRCTTSIKLIPEDKLSPVDGSTDEVQRVFDLEKGEWRSFRWDSVLTVD